MKKYVILLVGLSLLFFLPPTALAINQKTNYLDFTAWYQENYRLKQIPFRAAALVDAETLQPLYYYQETTVMPTASLIKLLTAGAFLSYPLPSWYTMVDLLPQENEELLRPYVEPKDTFSLLRLKTDEKITLEQAFATMLIGSANNIAVALPRYLSVSRDSFINRLQQTAQTWGMSNTQVDEPSGLSLNNLSTAQDLAQSACHAFKDFMISYYSRQPTLTFTTNQQNNKLIRHTVYALRHQPQEYFGAKTGYLRETQYHLAVGIISPRGRKLCAAILTSPTRQASEQTAAALAKWADIMYDW